MKIAVVTRAPAEHGNMASAMDVYRITKEASWDDEKGYVPDELEPLGLGGLLTLRQPVFYVGEILILNDRGRELGYPGRKPGKWDVDIEYVSTLEEAGALAERVMNYYPKAEEAEQ